MGIEAEELFMSRILFVIVSVLAVANLSACWTIGKGKGKAPPPAAAIYK
jgi:hypothetical protein